MPFRIAVLPAKSVSAQVKAVTAWAWLTTLLICCIVPIDVYSTLQSKDPAAIGVLWNICYWSTQLLTWALIPLYTGYADAGEFTWKGRMIASARSNGLLMVMMARSSSLVPSYAQALPRTHNCVPKTQVVSYNKAMLQAVAGCVGIFWAVSSGNLSLSTLPSLAIQLNNTFGLFCVLTLLGYGLVAIPKHLWKRADPSLELRRQLYR